MTKHIPCSEQQLDEFKIIEQVCQKYHIPVDEVTWDNNCYCLPDYNKPNFDLFPEDVERFNHVLLKKELEPKQHDLDQYLRNKEVDYCDLFLDKYLNIDTGRKDFLTFGHLIACSLVPYAEGAYAYFSKDLPLSVKKNTSFPTLFLKPLGAMA